MNIRNILVGIFIVVAVGGIFWSIQTKQTPSGQIEEKTNPSIDQQDLMQRDVAPQKNMRAPHFSLETLDGKTVALKDNQGKPTLINFWASWCPPCKVEMPHIQKAYETYDDRVNFLMVNLTAMDQINDVKNFLKNEGYNFPVLLDQTGDVGMLYQSVSIPTTFVVDQQGIIAEHIIGPMSEDQLMGIMKKIAK